MTHGQSDSMPNVSTPIVVEGPEQITALDAALTQLLKEDVDSKYLQLSPALRVALRDYVIELKSNIEELCQLMVDNGLMYPEDG